MNNESWDEDDDASRYFFEEIIDKSVGVADDEDSSLRRALPQHLTFKCF